MTAVNCVRFWVIYDKRFGHRLASSSTRQFWVPLASGRQGLFQKLAHSTGQTKKGPSRRLMDVARSTCSNGLVLKELSFVAWRFADRKQKVDVTLENATVTRSHGSVHTMELRQQVSTTRPALICVLCRRGVVLKSAPSTGSRKADIGGDSLIGSVARESCVSPRSLTSTTLLCTSATPSVQLLT